MVILCTKRSTLSGLNSVAGVTTNNYSVHIFELSVVHFTLAAMYISFASVYFFVDCWNSCIA